MNKRIKQVIALLLGLTLCVTSVGCSKKTAEIISDQENGTIASSEDNDKKAMGRFMEESTPRTEEWCQYSKIVECPENTLLFISEHAVLESNDGGKNWIGKELPYFVDFVQSKSYVLDFEVSKKGDIAVTYNETEERFDPLSVILKPDGTIVNIEIVDDGKENQEYKDYFSQFCFTDEGRLFTSTYEDMIYEVDTETGKISEFLEIERLSSPLSIKGNLMFCPTYEGYFLYDIDNDSFIEDEVLAKFIKENYNGFSSNSMGTYTPFPFWGNESDNVIYLAGEKGLYRHIIGGNMMEKVIDGRLSILGDVSKGITSMFEVGDEFVAGFSDTYTTRFYYDETVPTMPDATLTIYALEDNYSIKQAISSFRTINQNAYVDLEIGIKSDSVTKEDALKNLNTKLVDGSGPDIIIMDGMPIESYIEKGILLDIKDTVEAVNKENPLYYNIIEPFYKNDSLYVTPTQFEIPVLYCKNGELLKNINSLKDVTAFFEKLRKDNPNSNLWGICSEYGTLKSLIRVCAPCWLNEKRQIDEVKIREYLEESKKIYDVQMNGIPASSLEKYNNISKYFLEEFGTTKDEYMDKFASNEMDFISGNIVAGLGYLDSVWGLASLYSLSHVEGRETTSCVPFTGQCKNVYIPSGLIGVSTSVESNGNKKLALSFVEAILGPENQRELGYPLPVSRVGFQRSIDETEAEFQGIDERIWGSSVTADENGIEVSLTVYWPEKESLDYYAKIMEEARIPSVYNEFFENVVVKEGAAFLRDEITIEQAIENIKTNTQIYLTE